MYVIDGLFLTERITGIQRYAYEITKRLDDIVFPDDLMIVVPKDYDSRIQFKNIKIEQYGHLTGRLWEQFELPLFMWKRKAQAIYFENTIPLFYRKGLVVIHDISLKVNPHFFDKTLRGKLSVIWRKLNYYVALNSDMKIVTVSEFSKSEIIKHYRIKPERISVIYNSWEQMLDVDETDNLFEKYPKLSPNGYYFAMASIAPNKNFKWIVCAAKNNPEEQFAIAGGGKLKEFLKEHDAEGLNNLHLLGYVSDSDAKALMRNCKAFLFPTLYEGFGIPPLEAVAAGAPAIIVSDIPCMHEIYGEFAQYIAPDDYKIEMSKLELKLVQSDRLLGKYSWQESASRLTSLIWD